MEVKELIQKQKSQLYMHCVGGVKQIQLKSKNVCGSVMTTCFMPQLVLLF